MDFHKYIKATEWYILHIRISDINQISQLTKWTKMNELSEWTKQTESRKVQPTLKFFDEYSNLGK